MSSLSPQPIRYDHLTRRPNKDPIYIKEKYYPDQPSTDSQRPANHVSEDTPRSRLEKRLNQDLNLANCSPDYSATKSRNYSLPKYAKRNLPVCWTGYYYVNEQSSFNCTEFKGEA